LYCFPLRGRKAIHPEGVSFFLSALLSRKENPSFLCVLGVFAVNYYRSNFLLIAVVVWLKGAFDRNTKISGLFGS
jgi:hypothetical protein